MVYNIGSTDDDFSLWMLLEQARDVILRARQKELRKVGISFSAAKVLDSIQAIGAPAIPAEISRRILRKSHSVSKLLQRMEKGGLIRRVKNLDRKNLVRVVITEKRRQAYEQSIKGETIHQVMSSLSKEERQQIGSCLQKLRSKALED